MPGRSRLSAVHRAADGGARGPARRDHGAVGDTGRGGDRPFRHGAGAQGRSGAEVRLAAAGAGGRALAPEGRGAPGWAAFDAAAAAAGYAGERAAVLEAARLRLRPWARAAEPEAEDTGALLALARASRVDGGARGPREPARGWPDGRGRKVEESPNSREKWRRVTPARGNPRESATEIRPPDGFGPTARVKRWGKSPPRRRQRRWHGKPRQEQGQIGIARGPQGAQGTPARAIRVGCTSPSATAGPEEWSSAALGP